MNIPQAGAVAVEATQAPLEIEVIDDITVITGPSELGDAASLLEQPVQSPATDYPARNRFLVQMAQALHSAAKARRAELGATLQKREGKINRNIGQAQKFLVRACANCGHNETCSIETARDWENRHPALFSRSGVESASKFLNNLKQHPDRLC